LRRALPAPSPSGNDRLRNVQLGLGAGVLLGAFVSIGFVWLLANRNALRAFRAESAITPRPVQKPPRTAGAPVPNGPAGDTALNRRDLKAAKDVSPPNPS
jgi:hypothetical protein